MLFGPDNRSIALGAQGAGKDIKSAQPSKSDASLKDQFYGRRIINMMIKREIKFESDFPRSGGKIRFFRFEPREFGKIYEFIEKVIRVQTAGAGADGKAQAM